MNNIKWISIGVVGSLFAVSHLGMIGYIASRKTESQLPKIDIPVTPYTSYVIQADKDGYKLSYTANDPKTAYITKDIKEKSGFLGLANNTTKVVEELKWTIIQTEGSLPKCINPLAASPNEKEGTIVIFGGQT